MILFSCLSPYLHFAATGDYIELVMDLKFDQHFFL